MRLALAAVVLVGLEVTVCADAAADLERGVAEFLAGRFTAAIAPLSAAHAADPSDLDTQLLLGIAYYRLDDLERARPFLLAAARSADPETRDGAHIFLGLLADASGDAVEAHRYYDRVASSTSSLADSGRLLADRDRGERFAVVAVLRPEIDSNVPLLPATAETTAAGAIDSDLFLLGDVSVRPFAGSSLVLDEAVSYRKQARLSDYDAASSATSASWQQRGDSYRAALSYRFDASLLGGALYQVGHTGDASLRRAIVGPLGIALGYQLVARTLFPDAYAGYSGVAHTGTARLSWLRRSLELELGCVIARERSDDATLSVLASGGQLAAHLRFARVGDLRVFTQVTDRRYDPAAMGRRDLHVRAEASLFIDLSSHLGGVLGGSLLHDASNEIDLGYTKWTAYAGLVVATSR